MADPLPPVRLFALSSLAPDLVSPDPALLSASFPGYSCRGMTLSRGFRAGLNSTPFLGLLGSPRVLPTWIDDSDFSSLTVAPGCVLRRLNLQCSPFEEPLASHTYSALSFISSTPLNISRPYLLW